LLLAPGENGLELVPIPPDRKAIFASSSAFSTAVAIEGKAALAAFVAAVRPSDTFATRAAMGLIGKLIVFISPFSLFILDKMCYYIK
jgi:hypothetical protein